MLWACILLPQLALDDVLRRHTDPGQPLVLLSGPAQRRILQAVNPAAKALGLRAGQLLSAAQAIAHGFSCVEHDPASIEQCEQLLAAWGYRFSSQVSRHFPRTLLLEVQSGFNLFGPWPQFEARLREELVELGFSHRIVLAPNPLAARMLANLHDGLAVVDELALQAWIGQLPIDRVGLPRDTANAFARMGLHRVEQVLALPRDTLARRFANSVLGHLDTLLGRRPMALAYYVPPDRFDTRLELNFDVESHQALLFPLRRLIGDLAAFLAGRDGGVQRFELHLEHVELPATRVPVGLLAAERDSALLFELARGRLEQILVPCPVRSVRLVAEQLPSFVPAHRELFDERAQQSQPWEQLRERLRARLGDDAVQGLQARADHRPERAWGLGEWGQGCAQALPVPRPGWLLREPKALGEHAGQLLGGPERIETGWWDGADVRRDYYRLQTPDGQCAWVYQAVGEPGRWWLQGWFG
jgi:protein ImuB